MALLSSLPFIGKRAKPLPKGTQVKIVEQKQLDALFGPNQSAISDQLGPGEPMAPVPLDNSGRPRQFWFPSGWNLPSAPGVTRIDYDTLRAVSDSYPLLRKCLEIRKNELARLPWSLVPRYGTPMEKRAQLKENATTIRKVQKFFDKPDQSRTWQDWIRALLEDHFVLDAIAIHRRRTYGGKLVGLDLVDGATIKVLLDLQGHIPAPPNDAYQQYIAGLARTAFTTKEMQYAVQNVRNHTPYGLSIVEANLSHFNLAMRWEAWTTAVFTDGSIPQSMLSAPEGWGRDQISDLMEFRKLLRQGDPKSQRDLEMLPYGVQSIMANGADGYLDFSGELTNYLIDMTGAFLDVTRQELGLDPSNGQGLGGSGRADAQENVQYRRSLLPLAKWLADNIFTPILPEFGLEDFAWDWPTLTDIDPAAHSDMLDKQVKAGLISLDDARLSMGQEPLGIDPFIETSAGLLFMPDLKAMQKVGAKVYDTTQQADLAQKQSAAQNQQASHASGLKKDEAEHAHGLEKEKAEHAHGLGLEAAQHESDLGSASMQEQAGIDQQSQQADQQHQMALADQKSGFDQQAADQQHQNTLAQNDQQHGHASDLAQFQADQQSQQMQGQHELDQQSADAQVGRDQDMAEHGSGLKQDEAIHASGLERDMADHVASISEDQAHNDYGRQYDMATYQSQLAQTGTAQQAQLKEDASGADHGRALAMADVQHGHSMGQASHQDALQTGQARNQFGQQLAMADRQSNQQLNLNDIQHQQKKELGGIDHGNKRDLAATQHRQSLIQSTHQAGLSEDAAARNFTRDSAKAEQAATLAQASAAHAAKLKPAKPVKKAADLDFAFDPDFAPEFEQAALVHGTIASFPKTFRASLDSAGYGVVASGAEVETDAGEPVAAFVDTTTKSIFISKFATVDDVMVALADALIFAQGEPVGP